MIPLLSLFYKYLFKYKKWKLRCETQTSIQFNMVAISLYRGNLHRAPDVPRRWLMPNPKISLKDFKSLLARRSKALSTNTSPPSTSSNPNPNPNAGEGPSTTAQQQQQYKEFEIVDSKKPLDASDSLTDSKNDALEKPSDGAATEKPTDPVAFSISDTKLL